VHKSYIRRYHANAIFHRIRAEPNISQRDIVAKSGFDKSTVSSIITRFSEMGLVVRSSIASVNKPGRPMEGLMISPESDLVIGVQVEAEEISFVIAGLDGIPLCTTRVPFAGLLDGLPKTVADGIEAIKDACERKAPILGVGISFPGLVSNAGVLTHAPVLKWRNIPVIDIFSSVIPYPVFAGNDGKAAAMAEHMFGECIDVNDFIYLFSGSGVGGALFLEGDIYRGSGGFAGELGHIKVVPQGRICPCGATGCLSTYLSEPALAEEVGRVSGNYPASFDDILVRAAAGEPLVLDVLTHAGEMLGSAISSMLNVFDPPFVCLGGDMAKAEIYLRPSLERSLARHAHPPEFARQQLIFSQLSSLKPYLGGIALALDGVTGLDSPYVHL
jgi:predicted NBD/HSP70 family sugar kinase